MGAEGAIRPDMDSVQAVARLLMRPLKDRRGSPSFILSRKGKDQILPY